MNYEMCLKQVDFFPITRVTDLLGLIVHIS
jgi:hypothetical protein